MTECKGSDEAGRGRIELELHGQEAVFSEMSYRYPLKLLSPRIHEPAVAIVYLLTYGGGLVGGDHIDLRAEVNSGSTLMMLTQGSTKVFKYRPGQRLARVGTIAQAKTIQNLTVTVQDNALLLLLPDPVTCFASASYSQFQTFHLSSDASAILLDWFTSGRMSRGEEWQFSRYHSVNEIWLEKKRVARDSLLLEEAHNRSLRDRLGVYSCYATLFLFGPRMQTFKNMFENLYQKISVYQQSSPPDFIWSLAMIDNLGCVVRIAGKETEHVKIWLKEHLQKLENLIGIDVYNKAFV